MSDSEGFVQYSAADGICTLTISRPAKKNAFTIRMYEQAVAALAEAEHDPSVRVIVIRGEGGSFSAGNDILDFASNPPSGEESAVFRLLKGVIFAEKPIVAAVEGAAVGIGTTLLFHCDFVVAAESAFFKLPFVDLALTPEGGSSLLLPQMAGMQRASEVILLCERFDAATAREFGFVNRVVPADQLEAVSMDYARRIAAKAPEAVHAAKRLLREPVRRALGPVLMDEALTFVQRLHSAEAAEAFSAFLEKRPAKF